MRVSDSSTKTKKQPPARTLLSPVLFDALTELAAVEDLPVTTLIAILLNEALGQRLHRGRSQ
jgi:hypothetical protein